MIKKRILAEYLKKMKLEVEDRERIRCINDQLKRILRLNETEAENIAPPPSPLSSSPCPAPAPLPPSAPAPPPAPQSWVWVKRRDQVHLPTPPIHCSHIGPHLGTLGSMGTKISFLVPIFFQSPHFLHFRPKNASKVRAATI